MMNKHDPAPHDDELRELAPDEAPDDLPDDALDALLAADADAWRATLPAEERFAARMIGVLHGADGPGGIAQGSVAVVDNEQGDVTFIREPLDEPRGDRRRPVLPRRPVRGLLAVGAMAAVVAVLVVVLQVAGPLRGGYLPAAPTQVVTAKPPVTLAGGAWQQIALPVARALEGDYAVSPADPATIYACFSNATPNMESGQMIPGPISVWVTHDTGRHWGTVGLPPLTGLTCHLSLARGAPNRIGLLVEGVGNARQACDTDSIYLSDDGGTHWRTIPYQPASEAGVVSEGCLLTVTRDAVYIYSSWLTGEPGSGGVQVSAWQRTTDTGQTWRRLDGAFGAQTLSMPWEVGASDTFIASVWVMPGASDHALWITHDGGTSWQVLGPLPPDTGTFALPPQSSGQTGASSDYPIYALRGEQVPAQFFHLAAYESADGHTWVLLPPLPVPGATALRGGMLNVLGVDAAGRLYTLGAGTAGGVPSDSSQQGPDLSRQWLWIWDPSAARWERFPTPLAAPWPPNCGTPCWSGAISAGPASATYVWLGVMSGSTDAGTQLYRVLVR
ncbi:MAG TPA: hypothetical protein VJQ45_04230 [Ktedonobacterales bacterium]|nr:hypothetical protein [Ktedonobacterales bacterium]